jgi:hypothetical protein
MIDATDCPSVLSAPFNMMVSGPTCCGKSTFVSELTTSDKIQPKPTRVILMYGEWQQGYEVLQKALGGSIELLAGWHPEIYNTLVPQQNNLIIMDDIIGSCKNDNTLAELFTRGSHHRNVSLVLITQNYFWSGASSVDVRRNLTYLCLFRCKQDWQQIARFGQRILPPSRSTGFMHAYDDATRQSHGYLFIDMHTLCAERFMLRSNILGDRTVVYFTV